MNDTASSLAIICGPVAHGFERDKSGEPITIGHMGWGGCLGCANKLQRLGIGYVTTQMGVDVDKDDRAQRLQEAVSAAVGLDFHTA